MNHTKAALLAMAIAVAVTMPVGMAFAEDAIANNTSTSMGTPYSSPSYSAPRSAIVPGLPAQELHAQQMNRGHQTQMEAGEIDLAPPGSPPVV